MSIDLNPPSEREWINDADVTELDYEDEPTVDMRDVRLRRDSLFPPADPDSRGEVFSLIEQRTRPSLMLIDESPIDLGEVMRAPSKLPAWDELPNTTPVGPAPRAATASSIAPVAMPSEEPEAPPQSTTTSRDTTMTYAAVLAALGTVAAAVLIWSPSAPPAPAVAAIANVQPQPVLDQRIENASAAVAPHAIDLQQIAISANPPVAVDTTSRVAPAAVRLVADPAAAEATAPAIAAPPAAAEVPESSPNAPEALPPVAPPAPAAPPFDPSAASTALSVAASQAAACREPGTPSAQARISVTFGPSGRVAALDVGGAYAGSAVGSCIAQAFRSLRVAPFDGAPVTVHKTFQF